MRFPRSPNFQAVQQGKESQYSIDRTAQAAWKAVPDLVGRRLAQHEYVDHQGNPVVLGKYISDDFTRPENKAGSIM